MFHVKTNLHKIMESIMMTVNLNQMLEHNSIITVVIIIKGYSFKRNIPIPTSWLQSQKLQVLISSIYSEKAISRMKFEL